MVIKQERVHTEDDGLAREGSEDIYYNAYASNLKKPPRLIKGTLSHNMSE